MKRILLSPLPPEECKARLLAVLRQGQQAQLGDLVGSVYGDRLEVGRLYSLSHRSPTYNGWDFASAFGASEARGRFTPHRGGTRIDLRLRMPLEIWLAPLLSSFLGGAFIVPLAMRAGDIGGVLAGVGLGLLVALVGWAAIVLSRRPSRRAAEALANSIALATMALPEGPTGEGYRVALPEPAAAVTPSDAEEAERTDEAPVRARR